MHTTIDKIARRNSIAGQYALDVTVTYDWEWPGAAPETQTVTFIGSWSGAPVVMLWHDEQILVTHWQQFGDRLDDAWVRRFYGLEVAA